MCKYIDALYAERDRLKQSIDTLSSFCKAEHGQYDEKYMLFTYLQCDCMKNYLIYLERRIWLLETGKHELTKERE